MMQKGENLGKSCNQLQEQMNKHEVKQSKQEFLHYIVQLNYVFVIKHQENFLTRFNMPIFMLYQISEENLFVNILNVGSIEKFPPKFNSIKTDIARNEEIIDAREAPQIGVIKTIRKSRSKTAIFDISEQI